MSQPRLLSFQFLLLSQQKKTVAESNCKTFGIIEKTYPENCKIVDIGGIFILQKSDFAVNYKSDDSFLQNTNVTFCF